MHKLVNFMCDTSLLKKFDEKANRLGLTRTELIVALMQVVVKATEDSEFSKIMLKILTSEPLEHLEYARILASSYKEAYESGKR